MRLYNTFSRKTEEFSTHDGKVRMYVCGITPYGRSHIGHAMFSVVFDVVRRYLEFKGYEVEHVQNFTDIDDKMIRAAAEASVSTTELAESNIEAYLQEMDALNVLRADKYPRATDEMPKIIEMVESLEKKGYAYQVDGSVYYRVHKYGEYGKLSRRSQDSLMAGARVEVDETKEDVMDFALWKSQKPGEPAWDSPWGPGRPGWHIECSAMSIAHLGATVDIHGGGQDLIFPHHENEIAQSEPYTQVPFVRFWVHNGTVRLGEDKMSKSLGNIISIDEALQRYSADGLRLFFLGSHYRSPLIYSHENVAAQERGAERLRNAIRPGVESEQGQPMDPQPHKTRFVEAMDDDLNTPRALAALFDLARDINRGREEGLAVSDGQAALKQLAGVLGLTLGEPEPGDTADIGPFVELLVRVRADLRAAKQFELADKLRRELDALGVTLEDKPAGTEWRRAAR